MSKPRTVVVTGGARGLGLAIAQTIQNNGHRPVVIDKDREALSQLNESFQCYAVDLTEDSAVQQVLAKIEADVGPVDGLVNNAGRIHSEPLISLSAGLDRMHSVSTFTETLNANLISTFVVTRHVVGMMISKRTRGVIVNISSVSAAGNPGQGAYAAAKAGINALTTCWAQELGPMGIRCLAIAPGFIETRSTREAMTETILNEVKAATPLRRLGHQEDIAKAVLFALENDFVTGTVIEVDGGLRV